MKYTNKTKSGERKNRVVYDSKNNYYIIDNIYVLSCLKNAFNDKKSYWLSKINCTLAVYCFSSSGCYSVEEQLKNIDGYITMYEKKYVKAERKNIMKGNFLEWIQKIQKVHPKADVEVLRFIYDFSLKQGYGEAEEVLYQQFASGYCYYFAHMLQTAFNRGEVCWAAPYGHIVWVDENGIPYDISGVNESETNDYIPEYMMGDTILDFKHIASKAHNTSDQEISKIQLDWQDIRSKQEGSVTDNVGCVKLYYDAGCEDICFVHFDKTKNSIDDIQKTVGKCHEENLSTEKIISCLKEKFKNDIKIEEYLDTICI